MSQPCQSLGSPVKRALLVAVVLLALGASVASASRARTVHLVATETQQTWVSAGSFSWLRPLSVAVYIRGKERGGGGWWVQQNACRGSLQLRHLAVRVEDCGRPKGRVVLRYLGSTHFTFVFWSP